MSDARSPIPVNSDAENILLGDISAKLTAPITVNEQLGSPTFVLLKTIKATLDEILIEMKKNNIYFREQMDIDSDESEVRRP